MLESFEESSFKLSSVCENECTFSVSLVILEHTCIYGPIQRTKRTLSTHFTTFELTSVASAQRPEFVSLSVCLPTPKPPDVLCPVDPSILTEAMELIFFVVADVLGATLGHVFALAGGLASFVVAFED